MKAALLPMALLLALSVPALAKNDKGNNGNGNGNGGNMRGAQALSQVRAFLCCNWRRHLLDCTAAKKDQAWFVTRNFANASPSDQFDVEIDCSVPGRSVDCSSRQRCAAAPQSSDNFIHISRCRGSSVCSAADVLSCANQSKTLAMSIVLSQQQRP